MSNFTKWITFKPSRDIERKWGRNPRMETVTAAGWWKPQLIKDGDQFLCSWWEIWLNVHFELRSNTPRCAQTLSGPGWTENHSSLYSHLTLQWYWHALYIFLHSWLYCNLHIQWVSELRLQVTSGTTASLCSQCVREYRQVVRHLPPFWWEQRDTDGSEPPEKHLLWAERDRLLISDVKFSSRSCSERSSCYLRGNNRREI